ncbi:superoxide-generating NADPH oxidase heavy chain subunit C-like isoform X2 [Sitophilus oryzae]|uniref:Superoxide-generating NADPH oxidase heavy chain subunit C-like isoform X2 n=1 Tax=Sitophilus oryzae TaxID=7048 RepID=A0A6J2XEN0_SITOR|nr:superoxide-generating NADPH oxidase heavy chain subunit C-like isoform X2 [Sitophilus oryzae]
MIFKLVLASLLITGLKAVYVKKLSRNNVESISSLSPSPIPNDSDGIITKVKPSNMLLKLVDEVGHGSSDKIYRKKYNNTLNTEICWKEIVYVKESKESEDDRYAWRIVEISFDYPSEKNQNFDNIEEEETQKTFKLQFPDSRGFQQINLHVVKETENFTLYRCITRFHCSSGNFLTKTYYEWPENGQTKLVLKLSTSEEVFDSDDLEIGGTPEDFIYQNRNQSEDENMAGENSTLEDIILKEEEDFENYETTPIDFQQNKMSSNNQPNFSDLSKEIPILQENANNINPNTKNRKDKSGNQSKNKINGNNKPVENSNFSTVEQSSTQPYQNDFPKETKEEQGKTNIDQNKTKISSGNDQEPINDGAQDIVNENPQQNDQSSDNSNLGMTSSPEGINEETNISNEDPDMDFSNEEINDNDEDTPVTSTLLLKDEYVTELLKRDHSNAEPNAENQSNASKNSGSNSFDTLLSGNLQRSLFTSLLFISIGKLF